LIELEGLLSNKRIAGKTLYLLRRIITKENTNKTIENQWTAGIIPDKD